MIIETRFTTGDNVYHIWGDKITYSRIYAINIRKEEGSSPNIQYQVNVDGGTVGRDQTKVFSTKEELIKSL